MLPSINLHQQTISTFTLINNSKIILLPLVDSSFMVSHVVCLPGSCTLLPLQLLEFEGKIIAATNHLYWKTTNEINTKHFEIQRSPNAFIFKPIGIVNARTIGTINRYFFDDDFPLPGKNFYRLRIVDLDGQFTFSKIILLNRNSSAKISVYPNPANQIIKIEMESLAVHNYELNLTDIAGRNTLVERRISVKGLNYWELNVNQIVSGFYILSVRDKQDEVVNKIPVEIIH